MSLEITEESGKDQQVKKDVDQSDLIAQMQLQIQKLTEAQELTPRQEQSDIKQVLTELVDRLKDKPDSEKFTGQDYVREEDIDPNDVLEEGVTFFSHQTTYVIVDDVRSGHSVRTPYGKPITFIYQWTRSVKNGKETELRNLSAYTSHSKKEVEWLKKHSLFGSMFFEKHAHALSVDGKKAAILARIMGTLNRHEPYKIIKIAQQNGIPTSEDVPTMRLAIANKLANIEIEKEKQANAIRLKESRIEEEVIPMKQVVS